MDTLDVANSENTNKFELICRAYSESRRWTKTCKAMEIPGGCIVQVNTQHKDNASEALVYVPGVMIDSDQLIKICDAILCSSQEDLAE